MSIGLIKVISLGKTFSQLNLTFRTLLFAEILIFA